MMKKTATLAALIVCAAQLCAAQSLKFNLSGDKSADGYVQVSQGATYSEARGYGYEEGRDGTSAPASFSVKIPEGSYKVTVTLGDTR